MTETTIVQRLRYIATTDDAKYSEIAETLTEAADILAALDAQPVPVEPDVVKLLSEQDYEYNRKTNALIKRHAEQIDSLQQQLQVAQQERDDALAFRGKDKVNPDEFLEGSAFTGCRHTKARQKVWVDNGACPICLTASVGMANDAAKELRNGLGRAEAENAALKLDAERYRWWRAFFDSHLDLPPRLARAETAEMLDAAIDQARAK